MSPAAGDMPAPPRLSLEQHARLCAELGLDPANKPAILEHYGVDEEYRQKLDAFWGIRMQLNDSLRKAWEDYFAAHQAELRRRGGAKR